MALRPALRIAITVLAGGLVACGSTAATAPPVAVSPAASLPGLTAAESVLSDPKGDVVDAAGNLAPPSPIVDIRSVGASAHGLAFTLRLRLAGKVPANLPSSGMHEITYAVNVEADGSGDYDYTILVGNREDGTWYASLTDLSIGRAGTGDPFPGSLTIAGHVVTITVLQTALGMPTQLRLGVVSQRADHAHGTVLLEDEAPAGASTHKPGETWLTLK
jgi:hypothetical protein